MAKETKDNDVAEAPKPKDELKEHEAAVKKNFANEFRQVDIRLIKAQMKQIAEVIKEYENRWDELGAQLERLESAADQG